MVLLNNPRITIETKCGYFSKTFLSGEQVKNWWFM